MLACWLGHLTKCQSTQLQTHQHVDFCLVCLFIVWSLYSIFLIWIWIWKVWAFVYYWTDNCWNGRNVLGFIHWTCEFEDGFTDNINSEIHLLCTKHMELTKNTFSRSTNPATRRHFKIIMWQWSHSVCRCFHWVLLL